MLRGKKYKKKKEKKCLHSNTKSSGVQAGSADGQGCQPSCRIATAQAVQKFQSFL